MKCVKCGHAMETGPTTLTTEVRGEQVQVEIVATKCSGCERVVLGRKARRAYIRAAGDAYRSQNDLLTSKEIDVLRRNLAMTWKQFADYLGVGLATLKRWMGG